MTKNRQKNGSLNRDLLNFFYRYGIFWMPPGESSHLGGSEYVWQRGVEGVLGWVTGGQSWPSFQKDKMKIAVSQIRISPTIFEIRICSISKSVEDILLCDCCKWTAFCCPHPTLKTGWKLHHSQFSPKRRLFPYVYRPFYLLWPITISLYVFE